MLSKAFFKCEIYVELMFDIIYFPRECREVRELLLLLFDSAIITRRSLTLGGAHMTLLR